MAEIVVCDFEALAEQIYQFLEEELPISIKRVVDERNLEEKNDWEIKEIAVEVVRPYVGKAEIIVIANPLVTVVALENLKTKFPKQKFVGYGQGMEEMMMGLRRAIVLVPQRIKRLEQYQKMKVACQKVEITEPDAQRWVNLIDRGWLAKDEVLEEVKIVNGSKVIIYDPALLIREQKVEEMVGWRGEVTDMREEMLARIKKTMGIIGW